MTRTSHQMYIRCHFYMIPQNLGQRGKASKMKKSNQQKCRILENGNQCHQNKVIYEERSLGTRYGSQYQKRKENTQKAGI